MGSGERLDGGAAARPLTDKGIGNGGLRHYQRVCVFG